jgi:hypothetical protein
MIQDGGPAFPITEANGANSGDMGMSLRDYFAARAMSIMWDAYDKGYCGLNNQDLPNADVIAKGAYHLADAMLEARKA